MLSSRLFGGGMRNWISSLSLLLVGACAGQSAALLPKVDELAARQEVDKQNAIYLDDAHDKLIRATTVFANIARANPEICPRTAYVHTGMFTASADDFRADQRDAARLIFGNAAVQTAEAEEPFVYWVLPDSPAQRAGIAVGDRIVAVDGIPVRPGEKASQQFAALL